jgi:glutamine synthetase
MKNVKEVLKFIKDNAVEEVDFRFTDTKGSFHHITYVTEGMSESVLEKGIGFDGSSIEGWRGIENSDMVLKPDFSTGFIDPFANRKCLVLICDVIEPSTNEPYNRDPRNIAKSAEKYLKDSKIGDTAFFGPELEFFMFDDVKFRISPEEIFHSVNSNEMPKNSGLDIDGGNKAFRTDYKGGYFPVQPLDTAYNIRSEMIAMMKNVGLKPTLHHHEVAASQYEIGFEFSTLKNTADDVQKHKYVLNNVGAKFGKSVTFMPKPIFGDNGSGMHVHQSIWKNGKPTFFEEGNYADLSEICLYYIGGLIKHAKALNAFTNPTTNSYKRLVPGYEAPVKLAYCAKNRSAAIRIPFSYGKNAKRIEARFPDPSANPYLAFAALLMAGLDGIRNKIHPGEPIAKNLYHLSNKESKKVHEVCGSLREALEHLDKDRDFLKAGGVFNDDFIDSYIELKAKEVSAFEMTPHPIEFKLYYNC